MSINPRKAKALLLVAFCLYGYFVEATQSQVLANNKINSYRLFEKSLVYLDSAQQHHHYSLSIPQDTKDKLLPVIVFLHGMGGDENSDIHHFSLYIHDIISSCGAKQPIIIFPSNKNNLYILDQNYHIAKGLINKVAERFSLDTPSRSIITGFSLGGAFATRAAIVNPESFIASFSWAGGVWDRDHFLFSSVAKNARLLNLRKFKIKLFLGGKDNHYLYLPLIHQLAKNGVSYEKLVLQDQGHDFDLYLKKTRLAFMKDICSIFS